MTDRKTIAARIRALLAKTILAGATEAEALAALAKAQELMEKYSLDQDAVASEAEGCERLDLDERYFHRYPIGENICFAIARFTSTKSWINRKEKRITFFGLTSDVIFAEWLLDALSAFVERAASSYALDAALEEFRVPTPKSYAAFAAGCCSRISERLRALARAPEGPIGSGINTHMALVTKKSDIVEREFSKLGLRLGTFRGRSRVRDSGAYNSGRRHGDSATFNKPAAYTPTKLLT